VRGAPGVDLEPAFILHGMPYQETSQIIEILSAHHGRVGLVARGARRPTSRWRSILQPFQPLRLSWSGRGSLHTLRAAEPAGHEPAPAGPGLMAAWYLNELLLGLLRRGDPHPALFGLYSATLHELQRHGDPEPSLRRFELGLLAELGYGLNLEHEAGGERPLDPDLRYEYVVEHGPVPVPPAAPAGGSAAFFTGAELLAVARGDLDQAGALQAAKRLLRPVLNHYLGGRPLRTREVMAAMRRQPPGLHAPGRG
jgi:DNA repair protein RecO (recombination protein O)